MYPKCPEVKKINVFEPIVLLNVSQKNTLRELLLNPHSGKSFRSRGQQVEVLLGQYRGGSVAVSASQIRPEVTAHSPS